MEALILIVLIAAAIGIVMWNHSEARAAMRGTEFRVDASPPNVVRAIEESYCSGMKASAKSVLSRVQVRQVDPTAFRTETKIGDVGRIAVEPDGGGGSRVVADVQELYIGTHPTTHWRGYFYGFVAAMAHRLYVALDMAPNASRMKRFQQGIERKVVKRLRKNG